MLDRSSSQAHHAHKQECVDNLLENGWWYSRSQHTEAGFGIDMDSEWASFADNWNRLLQDEYMRDGGTYRYRRFSAFEYDDTDGSLSLLPHSHYEQSSRVNPLNGGFKRYFEPLERSFIQHPTLQKILLNFGRIFSETANHDRWNIKLHPYRIIAREGIGGEPAPEGLHQDGVDFIVSYFIKRVNVTGGISTITDAEKQFIGDVEMNIPNDFVVGDDRQTFHGVSPVLVENSKMPFAYRDVLVIAFEKI